MATHVHPNDRPFLVVMAFGPNSPTRLVDGDPSVLGGLASALTIVYNIDGANGPISHDVVALREQTTNARLSTQHRLVGQPQFSRKTK